MCALSLIEKEAIILENDADPQRILNIFFLKKSFFCKKPPLNMIPVAGFILNRQKRV